MPARSIFPGLKRLPKPAGEFAWYWSASQIAKETAGFDPRTELLWRGPGDPEASELAKIRTRCEDLTAALQHWRTDPENIERRLGSSVCVEGVIYFARCRDLIKIGYTSDPRRRILDLQVGNGEEIVLLGTMRGTPAMEGHLHQRFKALCVRGEWFRATRRLLNYIDRAAPAISLTSARFVKYRPPVDGPERWDLGERKKQTVIPTWSESHLARSPVSESRK